MIYSIYKLTNDANGKCYIGFTNNVPKRMHEHRRSGSKDNPTLGIHKAIKKYTWENFKIEILYCSKEKDHTLQVMEPYFIRYYNSIKEGYNSTKGGQSREGYKNKGPRKPLTEEQKKKISEANKIAMADPEIRKRLSKAQKKRFANPNYINPVKGMKHTETAKQNMSRGHIENMTDETKMKIGNGSKKVWSRDGHKERMSVIHKTNGDVERMSELGKLNKGKPSWNAGTKVPNINKICLNCSEPFTCRPHLDRQCCSKSCATTYRYRKIAV